ncbi:excalibur calcium-binding domain-containing protein [Blastococcus sp. TF02A_35]|uniref:excalibur calcium-binding domain-containing protein n=1 Tax=Blastococcus sp. TF02A-35 TaxID=2559612 RepID=UPI0024767219|nr:excalibur calcium-binding domain-containing protein [Blastococcus sp. TF02A_35]
MADDVQYEYTSAQAIRGTEAKVVAKWAKDGWEVHGRDPGLLRTELTFRRVKPATLASRARAAFGRLEPKAQLGLVAGAGVLVLCVIGGGVVAGTQGGGTPTQAASATDVAADAAPSEKSSAAAVRAPASTTPAGPTTAAPAPETVAPVPVAPTPQTTARVAPKPQTPAPVAPKPPAPTPAPAPVPAPAPAPQAVAPPVANPPASTYFKNCSAAKAAGAAPVRLGDAGYGRHLDSDGDGVGCES